MGVTNAFSDAIKAFADKADNKANLCVKKIVFDIGTTIVLKSPVGNPLLWKRKPPPGYVGGRFRANWQLGIDAINRTTSELVDKTGGMSIRRLAAIPDRAVGHVFYWTNSLPYANRLEDGWSTQAPPGHIIRLSVLEFDPIVRAAAAEVSAMP